MSRPTPLILGLALLLAACGGGGAPNPSPNPNPNPNPNPGSALITRLAACPVVGNTSDPTASACLAGAYTGKTLSGAACTLTVRADGGYDYASAALTTTYAPTTRTIRVFDYTRVSGLNQVGWLMGDPISAGETHDLKFFARWGTGITTPGVEIEVTKRPAAGGSLSSTCKVAF